MQTERDLKPWVKLHGITETRSSVYILKLLAWCFCGTPNSGRISLILLPSLRMLFHLLDYLVQPQYESFSLGFLEPVLSYLIVVYWRTALSKVKQSRIGSGVEEVGRSWEEWSKYVV